MDKVEILTKRDPFKKTLGFALVMENKQGLWMAEPVNFKKQGDHEETQTTFELKEDEAQCLMDRLFSAGFRPSDGLGSIGQLEATQKHLADMRDFHEQLFEVVIEKAHKDNKA